MKTRYVISRYSGTRREVKFNVRVARYMAKKLLNDGYLPVVPHIYFTQFLDDKNYYDHKKGTETAMDLLKVSNRAVVIIVDGIISEGMRAEIEYADELKIPYRVINYKKKELKKLLRKNGV